MSRTVSARIPTELHEELRERCNLIGESINDFIKAAIEIALHDGCEFDFGSDLVEELEEKKRQIPKTVRIS
jgi:predicted DNA-binding protein